MGASKMISPATTRTRSRRSLIGRRPLAGASALTLAASLVLAAVSPAAGGGTLDTTFNPPRVGADGAVSSVVAIAEGQTLIGGSFNHYNGLVSNRVAKLGPDGLLDKTFAANLGSGPNNAVASVVEQADHKILIGGTFSKVSGSPRCGIARLNADGSLDTGFNPGSGATSVSKTVTKCSWVSAIALQGDKPIIAGLFASYNGTVKNRIARLNADGSLDATFNPDVSATFGITTSANSATATLSKVTGLKPDTTYRVYSSTIPKSANVTFTMPSNLTTRVTLSQSAGVRAGTSVASTVITTGANAAIAAISVDPITAKVIIGGTFSTFDGIARSRIARLTADGGLDSGFSPGVGPDGAVGAVGITAGSTVWIAGSFTHVGATARNRIARLGSTGALDTSFDPGTGFNGTVYGLRLLGDGSVIAVGGFTTYGGNDASRIIRLTASGLASPDFTPSPALAVGNTALAVDADAGSGAITVGGFFLRGVSRLTTAGVYDTAFNPEVTSAANDTVSAIVPQSSGQILIAGNFTRYNGILRKRIARLNADGSLDDGFVSPGADGPILAMTELPGGKILIAGEFTKGGTENANGFARLNADGTLDTSFGVGAGPAIAAGTGVPGVYAFDVQTDGSIIVGGNFTQFAGSAAGRVARVYDDGTLDTLFNVGGVGADGSVYAVKTRDTGTALIGGDFTNFNGVSAKRLIRLQADGTQDSSFDVGAGPSASVRALAVQSDGKVIVGGYFSSFAGSPRNRLTRLTTTGALDPGYDTGGLVTAAAGLTITTAAGTTAATLGATDGLQANTTYGIYTPSGTIPKAGHITFTTGAANADGVVSAHIILSDSSGVTTGDPDEAVSIVLRGAAGGGVRSLLIQPSDGKVVAVGSFASFDGRDRRQVVRLMPDPRVINGRTQAFGPGSLDSTLLPGPGVNGYRVDTVAIQADKKLLIGGEFSAYGGNLRNRIVRINP
ncbi:MAG: delta-60 repeat domain-containing protein [Actinomycetes bacterium]